MIKESWGELSGCLESAVQAKTEVLLKKGKWLKSPY